MSKVDLSKIQKLSVLEEEIKVLTSKRAGLEADLERLGKELKVTATNSKREIAKAEQELIDKIGVQRREAEKVNKELARRDKQLATREVEYEGLEAEFEGLAKEKALLKSQEKQLQQVKAGYLEKEQLADLRAKQLEQEIRDLGKEPKKIVAKKEKPKAKKVAKKKGKK